MECGAMMGERIHDQAFNGRVSIEEAADAWNKRDGTSLYETEDKIPVETIRRILLSGITHDPRAIDSEIIVNNQHIMAINVDIDLNAIADNLNKHILFKTCGTYISLYSLCKRYEKDNEELKAEISDLKEEAEHEFNFYSHLAHQIGLNGVHSLKGYVEFLESEIKRWQRKYYGQKAVNR